MASQFDESDFVDREYQGAPSGYPSKIVQPAVGVVQHSHTPEELDSRVTEAHHRLADLRRAQEELERERVALEDARRRRLEFQTGREEMTQHLTRGITLLQEAEFSARRDSEQMAKSLFGLREALGKIESVRDEEWNQENWSAELARALGVIENARMEWNAARLKWELLDKPRSAVHSSDGSQVSGTSWERLSFWQQCKLGLALTWPVAILGLVALIVAILSLFR